MMSESVKDQIKVQGGRVILVALILGAWELSTGTFVDPFFVSSPSRIAGYLVKELTDYGFYRDLYVSAVEMAVGYVVGGLAGIVTGVLLARWELIARIVDPFLIALNSIPRMALAPLLIIWFGIDMMSKIMLAGTLVFFVTFFNTIGGIRSVGNRLCDVARVVGASEWQIFSKVMLPSASSWILTGLKMSLPFALIGVIVGEFMAASKGIGYRLNVFTTTYNITGAMTVILIIMVLMTLLNEVMNRIEAKVLRWRPRSQAVAEPKELR
jgi:NitT/TauT family transport system permease protein